MSPVLYAVLALLHAPARACLPGPATVSDLAPSEEQTDVPVDAVVRVFASGGVMGTYDTPRVEVSVDGVAIEGTLRLDEDALGATSINSLATFTPAEPLPAGARVDVAVYNVGWNEDGAPDATWSYTTGERAVEALGAAPTLSITHFSQTYASGGADSDSCSSPSTVSLQVQVELAAADPDGLSLIRLYQVTDGEIWSGPSRTWGPLGSTSAQGFSTSWDASEESWGERCFVVVQVDGAGRESPPSEVTCASVEASGGDTDVDDVGGAAASCEGCATGPRGLGLPGLALSFALALRRRWRPAR